MDVLPNGTTLEAGEIEIPGGSKTTPIVIEESGAECPHGQLYVARQGRTPLLITLLDPDVVARQHVRSTLVRDVQRARTVRHKNLLPGYGIGEFAHTLFVAYGSPEGHPVRDFIQKRMNRGKRVDPNTAYTLCAHVCNALTALQRVMVHGYVTADTVHVSAEGRVLVSAAGLGGILAQTPGFMRFRIGGLLPNVAPEQMRNPPEPGHATDVFGVATLMIEILTGRALPQAGDSLAKLGLREPRDLVECLKKATSVDPDERYPNVGILKAEIAAALGISAKPGRSPTPLEQSQASPAPHAMPAPPHGMVPPVYPQAYPPMRPPLYPRPQPPGYPQQPGYPMPQPPGYPLGPGYPQPPPGYPHPHGYPLPQPMGYPGMQGPSLPPEQEEPPLGEPTIIGIPAPPLPPEQPAPPAAPKPKQIDPSSYDISALEAAATRLEAATEDDAYGDLTEDVADSSSRASTPASPGSRTAPTPASRAPAARASASPRAAPPPSKPPAPVAVPLPSDVTDSALGLELQQFEQALSRLSTVDGGESGLAGLSVEEATAEGARPDEKDPSKAYFGSFAEDDLTQETGPKEEQKVSMADVSTSQGRRAAAAVTYILTRNGIDQGPYGIDDLIKMIKRKELTSVDSIRDRSTDETVMVVDVPALREVLQGLVIKEEREKRGRPVAKAEAAKRREARRAPGAQRGALGTALLVLAVIVAFAAAGVFLWLRRSG